MNTDGRSEVDVLRYRNHGLEIRMQKARDIISNQIYRLANQRESIIAKNTELEVQHLKLVAAINQQFEHGANVKKQALEIIHLKGQIAQREKRIRQILQDQRERERRRRKRAAKARKR